MSASLRCPDGHVTQATDYCDVCGLPMSLSAMPPDAPGPGSSGPGSSGPGSSGPGSSGPGSSGHGARPGGGAPPAEKDCPVCGNVVPAGDLFCENCGYDFTTGQRPVEPAALAAPGGLRPAPGYGPDLGYHGDPDHQPAPRPQPDLNLSGPGQPTSGQPVPGQPMPAPTGPGAFGPQGPTRQPPPAHPDRNPGQQGQQGQPPADQGGAAQLTWVAEVWVDPDWFSTQESDEPCPSSGMPMIIPLWDRSLLIGRVSVSRNIHPQIDCGTDHGVSRRHAQLTTDGQRWWIEDLQSSNGTFVGVAGAPLPKVPVPAGQRVEFAAGDRIYVGAWSRVVVRRATADER